MNESIPITYRTIYPRLVGQALRLRKDRLFPSITVYRKWAQRWGRRHDSIVGHLHAELCWDMQDGHPYLWLTWRAVPRKDWPTHLATDEATVEQCFQRATFYYYENVAADAR